jgi:hypothetical protein
MQRFFCDSCGKELVSGSDCRYLVRMEAKKLGVPTGLTEDDLSGQDDPDHIDAMDELLATADESLHDTKLELEPVTAAPPPSEFDLCGGCYTRFQADPLGLGRSRKMHFSAN